MTQPPRAVTVVEHAAGPRQKALGLIMNVVAQAASQDTGLRALTMSILNSVRTQLVEEYRNDVYNETAAEMFPPKEVEGQEVLHEMSEEDDRAVTARIKDKIEAFKASLMTALAAVPTEEEGFIDPRGNVWRQPDLARLVSYETPLKGEWHILSIFDRGDSVAVYAFPVTATDAAGKQVTYGRILLSRHVASASWKPLTSDAFKREIVAEILGAYWGYYGDGSHMDPEKPWADEDEDAEETDETPPASGPTPTSAAGAPS